MGYTTEFTGSFKLNRPLAPEHKLYLEQFSYTRRVKRDAFVASTLPDRIRREAGLPIGKEGGYFVGSEHEYGQGKDGSVVDYNGPPDGQPGLWCQWVPSKDGESIVWDGGEKFYEYIDWIKYLIQHFLQPWGYVLNGSVYWQGEDGGDTGKIKIVDNVVSLTENTLQPFA